MTHPDFSRRDLLRVLPLGAAALTPAALAAATPARVTLPLNRITDTRASISSAVHRNFWYSIWPQAVAAFHRGGVDLACSDTRGAVKFSAADRPIIEGLDRSRLNLILTGNIPMLWDNVRGLAGVTAIYDRADISMIALRRAHGFRIPFMDTNTVVHEILHALLGDIAIRRPSWFQSNQRELRVDAYATRLWLSGDGAAVRQAVLAYTDGLHRRVQSFS